MELDKRVLINAFIQNICSTLKLSTTIVDMSINTTHKFIENSPILPPIVNSVIACIHLNSKLLDKKTHLEEIIECAQKLHSKKTTSTNGDMIKEIMDLQSIILTYTNFDNLEYISENIMLKNFSDVYVISPGIVNKIHCLWKSVFYVTELRLKYIIEETLALSVYIFLNINQITLDDINNKVWYHHIHKDLSIEKLEEMFTIYSDNCLLLTSDIKKKIYDFINRSVLQNIP